MKYLKLLILIIAFNVISYAQVDTNSSTYYMYVYFINLEQSVGSRLAFSNDGINWQKYNNGKAIITPNVASNGEILMRDPNIYYESKDSTFHMVWTAGWTGKVLGYAKSRDLINWSTQKALNVGENISGCTVCWAPEIFYDDSQEKYMLYWATDAGEDGKRIYYSMTSDFSTFTNPVKFFDPGYSVIDATILKVADSKYYMFFKDERSGLATLKTQNIHYVVGTTPHGGVPSGYTADSVATNWSAVSKPITKVSCEGPTAIKIGDYYNVYFDFFREPSSTYRVVSVKNLDTAISPWPQGDTLKVSGGDFTYNHGSISVVPKKFVKFLLFHTPLDTLAGAPLDTGLVTVSTDIPLGKRNVGCGTGVGLAFIPPIGYKIAASRRRRKKILSVKK
jgi:beta-galactosidase